ncbi:MAG: peptide chain release factor N(5)-glutamine methyltransferase [Alphaproteobacteria bacterium]|nr:peptide chain release factor N(5)-glutamine methyltransferase [Alphaproteobacteria bacterium]
MDNTDSELTIAIVINRLKRRFADCGIADPKGDARVLTGALLDLDLTAMVLQPDRPVNPDENDRIEMAAIRRCAGEPVHRILAMRSFFGLDLHLSDATLEPRPDTEILVEIALPIAQAVVGRSGRCSILDLGTGTGAICLALLAQISQASAVATDISEAALRTARANAERFGLSDRFQPVRSNWFEGVDGLYDVIVSNPPYIRSGEIADLEPEVRDFDPMVALDGGADGLDAYRAIAREADGHLEPEGRLILETGFDQHAAVIALFDDCGFICQSRVQDLGGNDRVLVFSRADSETV